MTQHPPSHRTNIRTLPIPFLLPPQSASFQDMRELEHGNRCCIALVNAKPKHEYSQTVTGWNPKPKIRTSSLETVAGRKTSLNTITNYGILLPRPPSVPKVHTLISPARIPLQMSIEASACVVCEKPVLTLGREAKPIAIPNGPCNP